jgi:hypothetical protein
MADWRGPQPAWFSGNLALLYGKYTSRRTQDLARTYEHPLSFWLSCKNNIVVQGACRV